MGHVVPLSSPLLLSWLRPSTSTFFISIVTLLFSLLPWAARMKLNKLLSIDDRCAVLALVVCMAMPSHLFYFLYMSMTAIHSTCLGISIMTKNAATKMRLQMHSSDQNQHMSKGCHLGALCNKGVAIMVSIGSLQNTWYIIRDIRERAEGKRES